MSSTFVHSVRVLAVEASDRPALTFLRDGEASEETLSYGDLDRGARRLAAGLQARNLAGHRILIALPSGLDFFRALIGCMYAAAIPAPAAPPRLRAAEDFARILRMGENCSAAAVIGLPEARAAGARLEATSTIPWLTVDELEGSEGDAPPLTSGEDDVAFLQYTSGSTSHPRGVVVTHGNLCANIAATTADMAITAQTRFVSWLPLHHDMGLIGMGLQPLFRGAQLVLMSPAHFLQRPLRWLEAMTRYGGELSGGPNFAFDLCVRRSTPESRAHLDLSRWRVAFNGAEPVRADTLASFAEAFRVAGFDRRALFPCYGLAEGTLYVSGGHLGAGATVGRFDSKLLSEGEAHATEETAGRLLVGCGRPPAEHGVLIAAAVSRTPLGSDRIGEILVTGPSVARGYWADPVASATTFDIAAPPEGGRFVSTGDLGFLHHGELFVTGRLKDLLILRGRNVHPQDIEATAEAAEPQAPPQSVVAFAETVASEERLVIVKELRSPTQAAIQSIGADIARRVQAAHEIWPYRVVLTRPGALPRTTSGKLRRQACRAALASGELPVLADFGMHAQDAKRGLALFERIMDGTSTSQASCLEAPRDRPALAQAFVAPRTPLEVIIAGVWTRALGVRPIGIRDGFFELGGDSVFAGQVLAQLDQALEIRIDPEQVFTEFTVERLAMLAEAAILDAAEQIGPEAVSGLRPEPAQGEPARGSPSSGESGAETRDPSSATKSVRSPSTVAGSNSRAL